MTAGERRFMEGDGCSVIKPESMFGKPIRLMFGLPAGVFVCALTLFILGPDVVDSGGTNMAAYSGITCGAMLYLAAFALWRPRETRRWFWGVFAIGWAVTVCARILAIDVFQITSVLGFRLF